MQVKTSEFKERSIRHTLRAAEKKIGDLLGTQVFLTYNVKERIVMVRGVRVTLSRIITAVCHYYGYDRNDMMGEIRTPIQVVDARMMFSYLAYEIYSVAPLKEIGMFLALRNHSSVSHHCEKTRNFLAVYKEKRVVFNDLKQLIEDPNFIT